MQLLSCVFDTASPIWLRAVPAVETLRRVWVQQYYLYENVRRSMHQQKKSRQHRSCSVRPMNQMPITLRNTQQERIGYKVHLTETCEPDAPHLITHVETTAAPMADGDVTEQIHAALQACIPIT